jgi:hypothetical protein
VTKARTKAQRRRGRPRLPAEKREANGQKSRRIASETSRSTEHERSSMNVAVQARINQYSIRPVRLDDKSYTVEEVAKWPQMGYELGRLFVQGVITQDQHDAGVNYGTAKGRNYGLAGIAFPSPRSSHMFPTKAEEGPAEMPSSRLADDDPDERAARAWAKAGLLDELLLSTGSITEGREVSRIVQMVAVSDQPIGKSERALFLLHRGLNRLAKHFAGRH